MCTMSAFTDDIVSSVGMEGCNAAPTPFGDGDRPCAADCAKSDEERQYIRERSARRILAKLGYLACNLRADIEHSVFTIMSYQSNLGSRHWALIKRIVRYVKGTAKYGIIFYPLDLTLDHRPLYFECDANFKSDDDENRTTMGVVAFVFGHPIKFSSKLYKTQIAQTTTHAEIMAINEATRDTVYYKDLVEFVHNIVIDEPVSLGNDNSAACKLIADPNSTLETGKNQRYLEKRLWFAKYMVRDHVSSIVKVSDRDNRADILTKPLKGSEFKRKRALLVIAPSEIRTMDPTHVGCSNEK